MSAPDGAGGILAQNGRWWRALRALGVGEVYAGPRAGPELLGYFEEASHRRAVSTFVERQEKNLELIEVRELFVKP